MLDPIYRRRRIGVSLILATAVFWISYLGGEFLSSL